MAVILFVQISLFLIPSLVAVAPPGSVPMKIINHSGAPIELFWIDSFTVRGKETLIKQTSKPIRNNTDASINSYDTHEFMAKFLKPIPGAQARFKKVSMIHYVVLCT